MPHGSLDARYFDRLYTDKDDPWDFATSAYEARKYNDTLAMLEGARFANALEIGCSIGVLTAMLAKRCDRLLAVDISERALAQAIARCADEANVRFDRVTVPREFPEGPFDFVLLSEVGYYWSDDDLASARDRIAGAAPGGTLELVHFLPKVDEYVRDGDAVHDAFANDDRYVTLRSSRAERYRIDVLRIR
jgi:SAM-dependent methyltransferase